MVATLFVMIGIMIIDRILYSTNAYYDTQEVVSQIKETNDEPVVPANGGG